jgi:hypothetical protein
MLVFQIQAEGKPLALDGKIYTFLGIHINSNKDSMPMEISMHLTCKGATTLKYKEYWTR